MSDPASSRRYSGDVTVAITFYKRRKAYRGALRWPGCGRIAVILTKSECGLGWFEDPRSSEAYDKVARSCIREAGRLLPEVLKYANKNPYDGSIEVVRIQEAPCPI